MARIFLDTNNTLTISDKNVTAFGLSGIEVVKIEQGQIGAVLNSNIERIQLVGTIADYKFKQIGNKLGIYDSNETLVVKTGLQDDLNGTQLSFNDGVVSAKLVANPKGFSVTVDDQVITSTSTSIQAITAPQTIESQPTTDTRGNKIFLDANDNTFHVNDSNSIVFGAREEQAVVIGKNALNLQIDANVERIKLPGLASDYTFKQLGMDLQIYDKSGISLITDISGQDDINGTQLTFTEGTVNVKYAPTTTGLNLKIGGEGGSVIVPQLAAAAITIPEKSFYTIVEVSQAGSSDTSSSDTQFDFLEGDYKYQITGFGKGDVLNFPNDTTATLRNMNAGFPGGSPSDGSVDVQWAANGHIVIVVLTGLTAAQDSAIYSLNTFSSVFGTGSII